MNIFVGPYKILRVLGLLPGLQYPGFSFRGKFRLCFEPKWDAAGLRHFGKKQADGRGRIQTKVGENIISCLFEVSIKTDLEFYGVAHGHNVSNFTPKAIEMV